MDKRKGFTPLGRNISNQASKRLLTAFTLIELLVVIAIVALLMSILMPALTRVRKQAKSAICQMNLHHWGLVFSMYTDDNDGYFTEDYYDGITQSTVKNFAGGHQWPVLLLPYYRDAKLRFCPMATKSYSQGAPVKYACWQAEDLLNPDNKEFVPCGSYGLNSWCSYPPPYAEWDAACPDYWRRPSGVRGAHNIPLLMDAWWAGAKMGDSPDPPEFEGQVSFGQSDMCRFCIDRHDLAVNHLFVDWSVRKLGLTQLWTLKWHRRFDINDKWTEAGGVTESDWANWGTGWLKNCKTYEK